MNCPTCNNKNTKVIESRESSNSVRRRRECISAMKDLLLMRRYILLQ